MTAIETAIRDAVQKGGYQDHSGWYDCEGRESDHRFSDPAFWSALGKARGWNYKIQCSECMDGTSNKYCKSGMHKEEKTWLVMWHRFIDHLASGADAETFFANL